MVFVFGARWLTVVGRLSIEQCLSTSLCVNVGLASLRVSALKSSVVL